MKCIVIILYMVLGLGLGLAQITVISGGRIIDGTGADPLENSVLVINSATIEGIFAERDYVIPDDAKLIDASDLTILPGFINAHTHFTKDFEERRDNHLALGVTAICNLGAGFGQMPEFDVYEQDGLYAARGFKAGPFIAKEGGYAEANWGEGANYNIVGTDEAAEAVAALAENGADYLKISFEPGPGSWPILTLEEASAVVEAAHAKGLNVIAHVEDASFIEQALDSGVDAITHVGHRWKGSQSFTGTGDAFELHEDYNDLITRMAEEVVFIPTLDILSGERALDSSRVAGMTEVVRRFHERGGMIAMGNDYPLGVTQPGIPLGEIAHLMDAGLSEMEVIMAGTKNSAMICGHGDELGTLEPGKLADLILVEGNPLGNISALESLKLVMLDGEIAFDYR